VVDEVLQIPPGETRYWLQLSDELVEQLARGFCPEAVSTRAHAMLSWKRDFYRATQRETA